MSLPRYPLMIASLLVSFSTATVLFSLLHRRETARLQIPPIQPAAETRDAKTLSDLGTAPDWSALDAWQDSIRRDEFTRLLQEVFCLGTGWRQWIDIKPAEAVIRTRNGDPKAAYHLRFLRDGQTVSVHHTWHAARELPPAPPGKPLANLRISLDPGHLGGEWARMEERWFRIQGDPPVCEGDLTLAVAKLLKGKLETLGARVSLIRADARPLTKLRPADLTAAARASGEAANPADVTKVSERLFYRTAEIRARARLVNESLKPDLVICLHFNADGWGNAVTPTLVDHSHCHVLINGAFRDEEIALEDQRFEMLRKLLGRSHDEETLAASRVAESLAAITKLPPHTYNPMSSSARNINGNPYLWARNLLANRLYDCPVVFCEPYVMNSRQDYARIQAGDYEGERDVAGASRPSIFREYANAVADGLVKHYASLRAGR